MWQTVLFIACALVAVVVAAHEGYRLGEHRGYVAGKRDGYADGRRDGWNEYAAKLQERNDATLGAMAPRGRRGGRTS